MEPTSIFEKFTEQDVSRWVNIFAAVTMVLGICGGAVVGNIRKQMPRCLVYGLMVGLLGVVVAIMWHVHDARTSYWDHLYRDKNPGTERILWSIVGAGKLDSVWNIAGLFVAFILAGSGLGVVYGTTMNWLDRRYPVEPTTPPDAVGEVGKNAEAEDRTEEPGDENTKPNEAEEGEEESAEEDETVEADETGSDDVGDSEGGAEKKSERDEN